MIEERDQIRFRTSDNGHPYPVYDKNQYAMDANTFGWVFDHHTASYVVIVGYAPHSKQKVYFLIALVADSGRYTISHTCANSDLISALNLNVHNALEHHYHDKRPRDFEEEEVTTAGDEA